MENIYQIKNIKISHIAKIRLQEKIKDREAAEENEKKESRNRWMLYWYTVKNNICINCGHDHESNPGRLYTESPEREINVYCKECQYKIVFNNPLPIINGTITD